MKKNTNYFLHHYHEFKSTGKIPPPDFGKQFIRDLLNPEITSIEHINWIFDGKKVSALDVEKFVEELEKTNIPQNVIDKFVPGGSKYDFLQWFRDNFNQMFFRR